MIKVHHLESSRSLRILWLLEELSLEYEVVEYQRDTETFSAPESLKRIHPLGKSPTIEDDGLVVAESGAIIEYLLDQYDTEGKLRPNSKQALLDYRYWLHFAEGSLMPLLVMKLIFKKIPQNPMPFFVKPIAKSISEKVAANFIDPRLVPQLSFIEQTLEDNTWFTGEDLTGADIQISFPLLAASTRTDLTAFPNIRRFLEQMQSRPAYQRAQEKGGAYQAL